MPLHCEAAWAKDPACRWHQQCVQGVQKCFIPSLEVVHLLLDVAQLLQDLVHLLLDSNGRHVGDEKFSRCAFEVLAECNEGWLSSLLSIGGTNGAIVSHM